MHESGPSQSTKRPSPLRFLWAYNAADEATHAWHERLLKRRRALGFDVVNFCVAIPNVTSGAVWFAELDRRWRWGDRDLMGVYERLDAKLRDRDVLILYNGLNIHPRFADMIKVPKLYHCADDPESTEVVSAPVAPYFDAALVSNVASVRVYRDWGMNEVHFMPVGSQAFEEDLADLTDDVVADPKRRDVPIFLAAERISTWRRERFDYLSKAFPEAQCVGPGWSRAFLPWDELWQTYRRAQIGWNLHNSTGPINFRTYDLPACGVMQICDNKSHLGQVFELDREVVGFETLDECIDKTRYYLAHPDEQRQIALRGRERWRRDYTPDRIWERTVEVAERIAYSRTAPSSKVASVVGFEKRSRQLAVRQVISWPERALRANVKRARRAMRSLRNVMANEGD